MHNARSITMLNMPRQLVILALLLLLPLPALAQVEVVDVIVLERPDLPALTAKEIDATLALASKMLHKSLDRQLEMRIVQRLALDRFLADERRRIAPYHLSSFDLFLDSPKPYRDAVIRACREYGTLEQIKVLLPDQQHDDVKSYEDAADRLLDGYAQAIAAIKDLKTKTGKPLVTRENQRDFSIVEFDVIFYSMEVAKRPTLYLANSLIIDDNLQSPAPHTMVRGIAHGVAFPGCDRALVGYTGHLLGDRRITGYPWKLSDGGKQAAIAYTIAHEVGTHLLLKERDDYDRFALVHRPLPVDEEELLKIDQWPKRRTTGKSLDMTAIGYSRLRIRLEIAIARKDRAAAGAELDAIVKSDCPLEWVEFAQELYLRAKWE